KVGERPGGEGRELAVGPCPGPAGGVCGRAVDADPYELPLRVGYVLGSFAEQGDGSAPGDQPTQIGSEGTVQAEVECAGRVAGGERGAVAQIDYPFAGLDAP